MPSPIRIAMTAIQKIRPGVFACEALDQNETVAVVPIGLDGLEKALKGDLPDSIAVEDHVIKLATSPEGLLNGEAVEEAGGLSGKVAVVSGSASGLGKAVTLGMLKAGACVMATDIDAEGLKALEAEVDSPARLASIAVNVTDEASVEAGFDAALSRFGHVDAIACCAGIAPPFNLVDFPLDKWRLSLEINLTGYFLFGREAARIMTAQGTGGAMVLLSSKSGLEPSKANSAYNATKAGELHLARGWALELGRDGIRVNCVAPGNVFKGSKIWNPDYIKKAAEKKGIKPEEVIPYYNNLTAMNAEIDPEDIANAAVFLCSEESRRMTGQVLVVDAGQVWTR